jgi:hypothetical protein
MGGGYQRWYALTMPSVEDVLKKRIQKKAAELAQAAKNLEAVLWDLSEATRAGDQPKRSPRAWVP